MSEQFVFDVIEDEGGMDAIDESIEAIQEYREGVYYDAKNTRLKAWDIDINGIHELVVSIFTATLLNDYLTYQAVCGMLNHKIKLESTVDRVKTIAEVVAVIAGSGLIDITRQGAGESTLISSGYDIGVDIPIEDKHALNLVILEPVTGNYDDEQGSMILGHSMNHHDKEICLDHINRMNAIPLAINRDFFDAYQEEPQHDLDTPQKIDQWNQFIENSSMRYAEVVYHGNLIHLNHKYDSRGRSYSTGYHIDTQGSSYKKAIIELYNKEMVL